MNIEFHILTYFWRRLAGLDLVIELGWILNTVCSYWNSTMCETHYELKGPWGN